MSSDSEFAFPVLFGVDKKGVTKVWKACVQKQLDQTAVAIIEYGLLNKKMQTFHREYTAGKNIGKSNETSAFTQAISETQAKWNDKKNKESYSEQEPGLTGPIEVSRYESCTESRPVYFPMLAHTYCPTTPDKKQKIKFPCFVQPKLDGVRCIAFMDKNKVVMQSRTGSHFESLAHLTEVLAPVFKQLANPVVFDGELYTDEMPFEELVGLVKTKKCTADTLQKIAKIKYHVYDIVDTLAPFSERTQRIAQILHPSIRTKWVECVQTDTVHNIDEFKAKFTEYVESGYEGIMLRNLEGKYQCNYRSHDLQKYKEFLESEYPIVGYTEGAGKDKGTVIWICSTGSNEFSVRPRGTFEQRKEWFDTGAQYIGQMLTVIYQELSENGVPRFPVGKCIREGY
jgi:DNA ligase-1